jgi:hypothetical protein
MPADETPQLLHPLLFAGPLLVAGAVDVGFETAVIATIFGVVRLHPAIVGGAKGAISRLNGVFYSGAGGSGIQWDTETS